MKNEIEIIKGINLVTEGNNLQLTINNGKTIKTFFKLTAVLPEFLEKRIFTLNNNNEIKLEGPSEFIGKEIIGIDLMENINTIEELGKNISYWFNEINSILIKEKLM